uniref:Uncharacterized protein n=1 Tax=Pipistrellus kuhlii TaxID=59472 RepID=A0A7J7UTU5_PIPKU|nr:hypothetical protein mPipKuh1_008715 [Pipistrellus kuhlii]
MSMHVEKACGSLPEMGILSSAKGHLDIYHIIHRSHKTINLKISLLYLVKRFINSPLMPWQDQAKWFCGPQTAPGLDVPHPCNCFTIHFDLLNFVWLNWFSSFAKAPFGFHLSNPSGTSHHLPFYISVEEKQVRLLPFLDIGFTCSVSGKNTRSYPCLNRAMYPVLDFSPRRDAWEELGAGDHTFRHFYE